MTGNFSSSSEQPPFDETTQWSGPADGDRHDPVILGEALQSNPIAQEAMQRHDIHVSAAEAELQAVLDDRTATYEQINDARKRFEEALATQRSQQPPTQS